MLIFATSIKNAFIMNKLNNKKLLSYKESSRYLGISESTLRYWTSKSRLKPVKMGIMSYLDKKALDAIGCSVKNVEQARLYLEQLTEDLNNAAEKVRKERLFVRYKEVCLSSVNAELLCMIVEMLHMNGELTDRESSVLKDFVSGCTHDEICLKYGLTWTSLRQIILRGISRAKDFSAISGMQKKVDEMKLMNKRLLSKIEALEHENAELREKRTELEVTKPEIHDKDFEELDRICKVLETPLYECGFNKRIMTVLSQADFCEWGHSAETENCVIMADILMECDSKDRLLRWRNIGKKSLTEIEEFMDSHNLEWGMDIPSIFKKRAAYIDVNKNTIK